MDLERILQCAAEKQKARLLRLERGNRQITKKTRSSQKQD